MRSVCISRLFCTLFALVFSSVLCLSPRGLTLNKSSDFCSFRCFVVSEPAVMASYKAVLDSIPKNHPSSGYRPSGELELLLDLFEKTRWEEAYCSTVSRAEISVQFEFMMKNYITVDEFLVKFLQSWLPVNHISERLKAQPDSIQKFVKVVKDKGTNLTPNDIKEAIIKNFTGEFGESLDTDHLGCVLAILCGTPSMYKDSEET